MVMQPPREAPKESLKLTLRHSSLGLKGLNEDNKSTHEIKLLV